VVLWLVVLPFLVPAFSFKLFDKSQHETVWIPFCWRNWWKTAAADFAEIAQSQSRIRFYSANSYCTLIEIFWFYEPLNAKLLFDGAKSWLNFTAITFPLNFSSNTNLQKKKHRSLNVFIYSYELLVYYIISS
jgi:hypothetical protein